MSVPKKPRKPSCPVIPVQEYEQFHAIAASNCLLDRNVNNTTPTTGKEIVERFEQNFYNSIEEAKNYILKHCNSKARNFELKHNRCGIYLSYKVDNAVFEEEYARHLKHLAIYEERMKIYEMKMVDFKLDMEKYQEESALNEARLIEEQRAKCIKSMAARVQNKQIKIESLPQKFQNEVRDWLCQNGQF